jgi:hypothetical protein
MFSREEASRIKEDFWTSFGKYMHPIPSAEGVDINWINYHTGIKDVYFRMDARKNSAAIFISIEHRDTGIRELFFEQFQELSTLLREALQEEWLWQAHFSVGDGKVISRISKELQNVSIFNKDHWPELISFFKPRIIALDSFWEDAKYSFEQLK